MDSRPANGQSRASSGLSEKSLEELILSFRMGLSLFQESADARFRYVNENDPRDRAAALQENRRIMAELRNRKGQNRALPRDTLLKYRDCTAMLFTGLSGPYCGVEDICKTLLGEYDRPGCERPELPEF